MKKCAIMVGALLLLCGLFGGADAYVINYNFAANGNNFTSPYFATTENFEGSLLWTWTGNYEVVSGDLSGKYSAPAGIDGSTKDTSKYVTVPDSSTAGGNGSVMVTNLGGTYNYFGIWWGSMDTYNTFTFYLNGLPTGESFTGSDVTNGGTANGNQTGPVTNHYVNFLDLKTFDSFSMSSTQFAFEADNIAVGNVVPEPGTLMLLGSGLVGLAGYGRKRFRK